MDTIFALATAPGRAGVAVVRVSGEGSWDVARALCGPLPEPRYLKLVTLKEPHSASVIDQALVAVFDENASFTGEKVVEFQIHGSNAVVERLLSVISSFDDCRMAEAGEFTLRSFQNGRMDLAQVDGLADLINAESHAQLDQAMRVMSGALSDTVATWRNTLTDAMGLVAAQIDFADEEIPDGLNSQLMQIVGDLKSSLESELSKYDASHIVRSGFEVAIVGQPNVGKSTLLNAIAQRDAAIVTDIPGTTRDIVEVQLMIAGVAVTFLDTAGIRATEDIVESIGVERSIARATSADLRVFLREAVEDVSDFGIAEIDGDISLVAKGDINPGPHAISGKTGDGVPELLSAIEAVIKHRTRHPSQLVNIRHKAAVEKAANALDLAMTQLGSAEPEIISLYLAESATALDSLVGKIDVEDVLGSVFSNFCVGK